MQNMSVVFGQQSVECSQRCCEVQDGPQQATAHWTGTAYADLLVWAGHESLGLEEGLESSGPAKRTGSSLVEMTPSWGSSGRHGGVLLWQSPFFSPLKMWPGGGKGSAPLPALGQAAPHPHPQACRRAGTSEKMRGGGWSQGPRVTMQKVPCAWGTGTGPPF